LRQKGTGRARQGNKRAPGRKKGKKNSKIDLKIE